MIRSFIAVDLSTEVLGRIDQVCRQLRQSLPGAPIRWVPVKNIHLTLKFLGDVSEGNLAPIYDVLKGEAKKLPGFEIQVGKLGAFPSTRRPRVIWVGVKAPVELAAIQHAIDIETARLGYASEEREFSPHLTLGRISRQATMDQAHWIGEILTANQVGDLGACFISAVNLYRSDLSPQGATYTKLYSASFS